MKIKQPAERQIKHILVSYYNKNTNKNMVTLMSARKIGNEYIVDKKEFELFVANKPSVFRR